MPVTDYLSFLFLNSILIQCKILYALSPVTHHLPTSSNLVYISRARLSAFGDRARSYRIDLHPAPRQRTHYTTLIRRLLFSLMLHARMLSSPPSSQDKNTAAAEKTLFTSRCNSAHSSPSYYRQRSRAMVVVVVEVETNYELTTPGRIVENVLSNTKLLAHILSLSVLNAIVRVYFFASCLGEREPARSLSLSR